MMATDDFKAPSLREAATLALEALQEPVGFTGSREIDAKLKKAISALRAALALPEPAPVERQPLTDEELDLMCEKALFCKISKQQFARSIEAAHGIKPTC